MRNWFQLHIVIILLSLSFLGNATTLYQTIGLQNTNSSSSDTEPYSIREYDNLKDKYNGEEFIYERTVENSGWWTRFKQWLSDFFKDLFDINSDAKAADVTDIALKIFYVVIFLLVIFFIVKAIMNKEGNWIFGKSNDKSIIPVTDIENNIYETDFESLIKDAEKDNNYRLAIRYYYLWLLKTLSEKELIEYDVEKTNSDYYLELSNSSIQDDFSYTSYLYNYIWYGEFDIDDHQFLKAKDAFTQFLNTIKK
ncbi:DUF4129 domain-containing protein [Psychroserpens sp. MEBiC05023]